MLLFKKKISLLIYKCPPKFFVSFIMAHGFEFSRPPLDTISHGLIRYLLLWVLVVCIGAPNSKEYRRKVVCSDQVAVEEGWFNVPEELPPQRGGPSSLADMRTDQGGGTLNGLGGGNCWPTVGLGLKDTAGFTSSKCFFTDSVPEGTIFYYYYYFSRVESFWGDFF